MKIQLINLSEHLKNRILVTEELKRQEEQIKMQNKGYQRALKRSRDIRIEGHKSEVQAYIGAKTHIVKW